MNRQVDTDKFINDLERVAQVRSEISVCSIKHRRKKTKLLAPTVL